MAQIQATIHQAHLTKHQEFQVLPSDRTAPDIKTWKIEEAPVVQTRMPLRVRFPESMDHALAQRVIHVEDASGNTLDGDIALGAEERTWSFTPEKAWAVGRHEIQAATILEDLAGNQLGKVFEVDVFEKIDDTATPQMRWFPLAFQTRMR